MGEELGLSPVRLRELATGAHVHDIGKLSIPDGILKKPADLDPDEFEVITGAGALERVLCAERAPETIAV